PGERISDAVRRLGFDAPQSCRNGNCHICAANLISGRVLQHGTERSRGELFTCIAEPLEDCEAEWQGMLAPDEPRLLPRACCVPPPASPCVTTPVSTCCWSGRTASCRPSPSLRRPMRSACWSCIS